MKNKKVRITVPISGIEYEKGTKQVIRYVDGVKIVTTERILPDDPVFSAIFPDFIPQK